ncbi:BTAD domain-containing putative transcriptional regulator [Actinoplanes sp. NPDC051343]|uniref:AfsR/SARP family transcriptional regulator n=1 Tax=Actinoplanes sp. NPDC051343 TaxID=3363906 RepID=UPI0037B112C5
MIRLLGTVELMTSGGAVDVGPPQRRLVLAALAVDAGRPVSVEALVDRVWGEEAPEQARRALQAHLTRIRRVCERLDESVGLIRRSGGYLLDLDRDRVDVHRFRRLVRQSRDPGLGDPDRASLLRTAIDLWSADPLAGVTGRWAGQARESWRQQYLDAVVAWARAALGNGDAGDVLDRLSPLADEHPLLEPLTAAYLRALHQTGRTAAALDHYAESRRRLVDDLGIEPGTELSRIHQAILRGEADEAVPVAPRPLLPVPAQLPGDLPDFTGRRAGLDRLDALLEQLGPPLAVAITGTAGVGKTALAVHWAHRVRHRFPDGQLYVDLAGFAPEGPLVTAAEALRTFLAALGVPPEHAPVTLHEQTALYRSLLADRRVLVLLDNARDAAHVRPLLPGASACLTLVTSRDRLAGLLADGARPVDLDLLPPEESRQLLAARIGAARVAAEPSAVAQIVAGCTGLPLALAVVAVRAATRPSFPLSAVAAQLRHARSTLDVLDDDPDNDVRAVMSWSYRALRPPAARLFRMLGRYAGPDVSVAAAAARAGEPVARIGAALAELTRAHLLREHQPGRYDMHDLLRAYAAELADRIDPPAEREAADRRMIDHLLHTGFAAAMLIYPNREPIALSPPGPDVPVPPLADHKQAQAWFTAEHRVLLAAVRRCAALGWDRLTEHLAWTLMTFLLRGGHWQDWADTQEAALTAARRLDDRPGQAIAQRSLARALSRLGRHEESDAQFRQALDLFVELDDLAGQATTHDNLSHVLVTRGRQEDAVRHARRSVELYRRAGRLDGVASALNSVAWMLAQSGDPAEAVACGQEALTLHQQIGDRDGEAATYDTIGYAQHRLGDWSAAVARYERALTLYRALGDRYNIAATLWHLGDTQAAAGEPVAARRSWQEALAGLDAIGHPDAETVRAQLAGLR